MPNYQLQKNGLFLIKDYNQASPFSNFLPGIAGTRGIPLWVFYLNRGQAISSFGLKDKDGAIAEFYPANKAYSFTPYLNFRTFIKTGNNSFYEPFALQKINPAISQTMQIASGFLQISDFNPKLGLEVVVKYFTLPNQPAACLVRKVTFKNRGRKTLNLKVLDGLARIIPYGAANNFLKDMSRTLEAWMHSSFNQNTALFRLIVDPADVAQTTYIEGANFNYSFYQQAGQKIHPRLFVDPAKIFSHNLSYTYPQEFALKSFQPGSKQAVSGKTPSAFSYFEPKITSGQEITLYNLFGAAPDQSPIEKITHRANKLFLEQKEAENNRIIDAIKNKAFCLSGFNTFNHYISSSYLDNILRGGFPYRPHRDCCEKVSPYYIYTRKHGDPERDYNYFNLAPSFFSEGQGNYRDVNQNRRLDLFFQPSLKKKNITYFLNLIQADGYNPLLVKGEKLYFEPSLADKILKKYQLKKKKFFSLMTKGFYLGEFFGMLALEGKSQQSKELISLVLSRAKRQSQASHGEGYWIDHWRYNLDLIESFLQVYPDCLEELFLETNFTFFDDKYKVKPRRSRYLLRKNKVYQGESIEADKKKNQILKERKSFKNFLRDQNNRIYQVNLIEKLLVLILNKAASFDPDGLGLEMEADKPGWCDSLNGLPALFGSSLCETFELKRAALILKEALVKLKKEPFNCQKKTLRLARPVFNFFNGLDKLINSYFQKDCQNKDFNYWDKANKIKENFRKNTFYFINSQKSNLKISCLETFLENLIVKIDDSLKKAKDKKSGLYPAYFTFSATEFKKTNHHPFPLKFKRSTLPLFLEGVVHALRSLPASAKGQKRALFRNTQKSALFDRKLKMYKLNESLAGQPLDIGRSRVFLPGWLENESIWLHMEYKYLLELLKGGLYLEFFQQWENCAICFQDPQVYGRSILENSSFLVSSRHPDSSLHGKGFVARLTGATAELVNIWLFLSLGPHPFSLDKKGKLLFSPEPLLKASFFSRQKKEINWQNQKIVIPKDTYAFSLFGRTLVIYHNPKKLDTFDSECKIKSIELEITGKKFQSKNKIKGKLAQSIRNQEVTKIDIQLG